MKPMSRFRTVALALAAAASLAGGIALGQQPQGRPQPGQAQQGQPAGQDRPALPRTPPGHPAVPGMQPGGVPGQRPGMPPGFPPGQRPGAQPGQRPGMPGFNPRPRPRPAAVEHEEEHVPHECPGHGPDDPPPHINWWHGILMANSEAAEKGGFLNQLLFRYENPKNHCDPKNEPPPFLASLINFGVLAFVIYRFGRKPLAEALVARKKAIMADIDQADSLYEDAEQRLADLEEKLENIADKRREIREEFAAQAEAEKKHILAEAEERRARMRRDAEFRIEQELKTVRDELLREAVASAVVAAEELIAKQISAADNDKMAKDYLASIAPALSAGGRQ
jgi:F-type H+-transporting ATPase subunit b